MLKKFLLASILVLALNSVASAAYVEHNFKLVNDTGKTITFRRPVKISGKCFMLIIF